MEIKIHEINFSGISKISRDDFHESKLGDSSAYLYEIISEDRSEAVKELHLFRLEKDVLNYMLEPLKHIRFVTMDEIKSFDKDS